MPATAKATLLVLTVAPNTTSPTYYTNLVKYLIERLH